MRSMTVVSLLWTLSLFAFPLWGQDAGRKGANDRLTALEEKLSSSEEKVLSLKKDIADLSRQLARLAQQMNAMEAFLEEAMTDEAKQSISDQVKAAVLAFAAEKEGERQPNDVWALYWRYPRTPWSDDALWVLASEYEFKGEDTLQEAAEVWRRLLEQHEEVHLEQETVDAMGLDKQLQRRSAFQEAGGSEQDADRVTALHALAGGLVRLKELEDAKAQLEAALAICPAENLEAVPPIKALLRQVERMMP